MKAVISVKEAQVGIEVIVARVDVIVADEAVVTAAEAEATVAVEEIEAVAEPHVKNRIDSQRESGQKLYLCPTFLKS